MRLWNLWELMNQLQLQQITAVVTMLESLISAQRRDKHFERLVLPHLDPQEVAAQFVADVKRTRQTFERAKELCADIGLIAVVEQVNMTMPLLTNENLRSPEGLEAHIERIQDTLLNELGKIGCLHVAPDRRDYLEKYHLFGKVVSESFPSARQDITEAGNCFAAECCTATVFHLMRAAEVALRALARDRSVAFSDGKPLEQKQWGDILVALDNIIKPMREADTKKWPTADIKEIQVRFYSEVVQELRGFNEAFRKHVSHADIHAFYDRDYAMSIMNHVRAFFQKLATKISEDKQRKEFWDQP